MKKVIITGNDRTLEVLGAVCRQNAPVALADEAKEKIEQEGEVVPFSVLVIKDNIFIETHPGANPEMCFAQAQRTVAGARGADAYAFCYDGYADTDAGQKDMLIAEGGLPGEDVGYAVG